MWFLALQGFTPEQQSADPEVACDLPKATTRCTQHPSGSEALRAEALRAAAALCGAAAPALDTPDGAALARALRQSRSA